MSSLEVIPEDSSKQKSPAQEFVKDLADEAVRQIKERAPEVIEGLKTVAVEKLKGFSSSLKERVTSFIERKTPEKLRAMRDETEVAEIVYPKPDLPEGVIKIDEIITSKQAQKERERRLLEESSATSDPVIAKVWETAGEEKLAGIDVEISELESRRGKIVVENPEPEAQLDIDGLKANLAETEKGFFTKIDEKISEIKTKTDYEKLIDNDTNITEAIGKLEVSFSEGEKLITKFQSLFEKSYKVMSKEERTEMEKRISELRDQVKEIMKQLDIAKKEKAKNAKLRKRADKKIGYWERFRADYSDEEEEEEKDENEDADADEVEIDHEVLIDQIFSRFNNFSILVESKGNISEIVKIIKEVRDSLESVKEKDISTEEWKIVKNLKALIDEAKTFEDPSLVMLYAGLIKAKMLDLKKFKKEK